MSHNPDGSRFLGRSALIFRVLMVLGVLGLLYGVYASGLVQDLDVEGLRDRIGALGAWGVVGFVVATSVLQPLHISIYLFLGAAVLVWGPWLGGLLLWVATLGSAASSFAFARYLARDWVQARLPDRFRALDARLESGGLRGVIALRLVFFTTPALQLMCGVSRLDFRTYMLGTALGNIPWLVISVALGGVVKDWLQL